MTRVRAGRKAGEPPEEGGLSHEQRLALTLGLTATHMVARHSLLQIEEREVREGDGCGCPSEITALKGGGR